MVRSGKKFFFFLSYCLLHMKFSPCQGNPDPEPDPDPLPIQIRVPVPSHPEPQGRVPSPISIDITDNIPPPFHFHPFSRPFEKKRKEKKRKEKKRKEKKKGVQKTKRRSSQTLERAQLQQRLDRLPVLRVAAAERECVCRCCRLLSPCAQNADTVTYGPVVIPIPIPNPITLIHILYMVCCCGRSCGCGWHGLGHASRCCVIFLMSNLIWLCMFCPHSQPPPPALRIYARLVASLVRRNDASGQRERSLS